MVSIEKEVGKRRGGETEIGTMDVIPLRFFGSLVLRFFLKLLPTECGLLTTKPNGMRYEYYALWFRRLLLPSVRDYGDDAGQTISAPTSS